MLLPSIIARTDWVAGGAFEGVRFASGQASSWEVAVGFGIVTTIGLISGPINDQMFWQRYFSLKKNDMGVKKVFIMAGLCFALVPILFGSIGFAAAGAGFQPTNTAYVNLEFVAHLFQSGPVVFFMVVGLLAGLISTVDSVIIAIASIANTDFFKKSPVLKNTKLVMSASALVVLLVSNVPGVTLTQVFFVYGMIRASTAALTFETLWGRSIGRNRAFAAVVVGITLGAPVFIGASLLNVFGLTAVVAIATLLIPWAIIRTGHHENTN